MDNTRNLLQNESKGSPAFRTRFVLGLLASPKFFKRVTPLLQAYQGSGFQWLLRRSGLLTLLGLNPLESNLPNKHQKPFKATDPKSIPTNPVQLFLGCVNQTLDPQTLQSTQTLLQACGYHVVVSDQQGCCGALHAHHGQNLQSKMLAARNQKCFSEATPVVSVVTGCTAHLKNDSEFGGRVEDICAFLVERSALDNVHFAPLEGQALIHTPCSSGVLPHHQDHVKHCVEQIPNLRVSTLPTQGLCCGAAGTYWLDHPKKSRALAQQGVEQISAFYQENQTNKSHPKFLVTTNVGCALQWQSLLAEKKLPISVVHPVFLLAKQLQNA